MNTPETELVTTSVDGGVAWITLNRPHRLNAFVGSMRDDLHSALQETAGDASVRAIVITGTGRAFCAGADVDVMADLLNREDADAFAALVEAGTRVVRQIRSTPQPVVAAVNGVAAGAGASLAAACDLRIASDGASIGFTFNRIGLHPDWGATYSLPRLVGAGRATELILSARMVPAEEAGRIGLFDRIFPALSFEDDLRTYVRDLAAKPPLALVAAKHSLNRSWEVDIGEMLRVETEAQLQCFSSEDVREGISAFQQKRSPDYRGR